MTATILLVGGFLLVETAISMRHERALRARGAVEPSDDVYQGMRMAYPACFAAMIAEGAWRGIGDAWWWGGLVVFALSKALKFWVIQALGPAWSFRVLVVPGMPLVTGGPYRFVRHPNYAAVVGELIAVGLMTAALVTGPLAVAVFGWLLRRRIAVEERALKEGRREK